MEPGSIDSYFYLVKTETTIVTYPEDMKKFKRFLSGEYYGEFKRQVMVGVLENAYAVHSVIYEYFGALAYGENNEYISLNRNDIQMVRDKCMRALAAKTEGEAKEIMPIHLSEDEGGEEYDYGESYRKYLNKTADLLSEIMEYLDQHKDEYWFVKYEGQKY